MKNFYGHLFFTTEARLKTGITQQQRVLFVNMNSVHKKNLAFLADETKQLAEASDEASHQGWHREPIKKLAGPLALKGAILDSTAQQTTEKCTSCNLVNTQLSQPY